MIRAKPVQRQRTPDRLVVRALNASASRGYLQFGPFFVPCALGPGGVRAIKREGDGAAPRGRFRLREVYFRPDVKRPRSGLPMSAIRPRDGWCDSAGDRNYNRKISRPYPQSSEPLWRSDGLYDLVLVLGYNDVPRVRGRGSAIFMHVARPGLTPTEGCVALRANDLQRLLSKLRRGGEIIIQV